MNKHKISSIKEVGQGTGLGLATVYGLAKQNNGFVNVYSEPDQGTAFKIYLPHHRRVDETTRTERADTGEPHGSETILLVEDETTILKMTKSQMAVHVRLYGKRDRASRYT